MVRRLVVVLLLVLVVAGIAFFASAWRPRMPTIDTPPRSSFDAASIQRGAVLTAIGGCASCHTAPNSKAYAGGLPLETPFGTIYATNITPEPETGIGRWSLDAFVRAMREGVDRDGRQLYPAFPYDHFTRVADEDLRAIYAYLMTREPIRAEAPRNDVVFPLNVRMLVEGWKLLYFDHAPIRPDATQSAEWNRGAYLAEGLGHCGSCHTPRNFLGALKKRRHYAGGETEGWHAPALDASSRAPVPWTVDALQQYLKRGVSNVHEVSAGPMTRVIHSLAVVPDEEVRAIATYIASNMGAPEQARAERGNEALIRARTAAEKGGDAGIHKLTTGGQQSETTIQDGRVIYEGTCMLCHGAAQRTAGAPSRDALNLGLSTSIQLGTPANLIRIVLQGMAPPDGESGPFMPGFSTELTDEQLVALVTYLRSDFSDHPAWQNVAREVRRARQSLARMD